MTENTPIQCAECETLLADNEQLSKEVNTLRAEVLAENRKSFARGVQLDDANRQLAELQEAAREGQEVLEYLNKYFEWKHSMQQMMTAAILRIDKVRAALARTKEGK